MTGSRLLVATLAPITAVVADDGSPAYHQNQVLGVVPRATFGRTY
ncbi:hypothetical protein [Candidatus Solirubrobacter pratensis]|nr:hypothetical protein [Candidatus Solirubrobacter pratensis]